MADNVKLEITEDQLKSLQKANANLNRAIGDSISGFGSYIEHRASNFGGYGGGYPLGGGYDVYGGQNLGLSAFLPAIGPGLMFGAGLGYGFGTGTGGYGPWISELWGGGFANFQNLSTNAYINHQIIAACVTAYNQYGIIHNIIDLYADFASASMIIDHPKKSVREFYRAWWRKINGQERINRFMTDYFLTENVFVYRQNAKLSKQQIEMMQRGRAFRAQGEDILVDDEVIVPKRVEGEGVSLNLPTPEDDDKVKDEVIPWSYMSLNPLQIEKRSRNLKDKPYWVFLLTRKDLQNITGKEYNRYIDLASSKNLPDEFKNKIKEYKGVYGKTYLAEVKLDPEKLYVINGKKFDHWDWSIPTVYTSLKYLSFKEMLRNMELRAAQSMINSVFLWKLGDHEKGLMPQPEEFEKLSDILQSPGQALNVIWHSAISCDVLEPKFSNVFDLAKYESVDRDILACFGVSEVIVNGRGGNYANSYLSVSTTIERLNAAQNKFETWLNKEFKLINKAMGFRRLPTIRWGETPLTDKQKMGQLILNLKDRGLISMASAQEYFGFDHEVELGRMREEKKTFETEGVGILEDRGPFRRITDYVKTGYKLPDMKAPKVGGNGGGNLMMGNTKEVKTGIPGRPPGTNKPQQTRRSISPKGLAELVSNLVDVTSNTLFEDLMKVRGYKDKRSITKKDKEGIFKATAKILVGCSVQDYCSNVDIYEKMQGNNNSLVYFINKYKPKSYDDLKTCLIKEQFEGE